KRRRSARLRVVADPLRSAEEKTMTASSAVLREDLAGGVRLLTLNRPDKKNACNIGQAAGLRDAVREATADDAVRVIVVTGAGDAFSAGADMKTFAGQDEGAGAHLPVA